MVEFFEKIDFGAERDSEKALLTCTPFSPPAPVMKVPRDLGHSLEQLRRKVSGTRKVFACQPHMVVEGEKK